MTFISDTCSPWRRLYAVLSGTRQWMDTRIRGAWYPRRIHSCCLSRGGGGGSYGGHGEFLHARCTRICLIEIIFNGELEVSDRACAGWALAFLNLFLHSWRINMWIHYVLKSDKMIHRDSYWKLWTLWRARSRHEKVVGVIDRSIKPENNAYSCFSRVHTACRLLPAFAKGYSNKSDGISYN